MREEVECQGIDLLPGTQSGTAFTRVTMVHRLLVEADGSEEWRGLGRPQMTPEGFALPLRCLKVTKRVNVGCTQTLGPRRGR